MCVIPWDTIWQVCFNWLWHTKWETIMCDKWAWEIAIWSDAESSHRDVISETSTALVRLISPLFSSSFRLWYCGAAGREQPAFVNPKVCMCVCVTSVSMNLFSTTWFDLVMVHWWVLGEIGKGTKTYNKNPWLWGERKDCQVSQQQLTKEYKLR